MSRQQDRIRAVVRFRPILKREYEAGIPDLKYDILLSKNKQSIQIITEQKNKTWDFHHAFDHEVDQETFYKIAAKPVVENIFQGFNSTIFAYGQTGSGKTWSMMGPSLEEQRKKDFRKPELVGVIPRAIDQIFQYIENGDQNDEFELKVSYFEIYREIITDLLNPTPSGKDLMIRESRERGFFVQGLREESVASREEIQSLILAGNYNRHVGKTDKNLYSSRSHSILVISFYHKDDKKKMEITAKLNLVDLAGSERLADTKATGERKKEGIAINQSLTSLGNCIAALVSNKKERPRFRDSKLTKYLKSSITGKAKTLVIAAANRLPQDANQTIGTLNFAYRASNIKLKVKANRVYSKQELLKFNEQLKMKLKAMLIKVKDLRGSLDTAENIEYRKLKAVKAFERLLGKAAASQQKKRKKEEDDEDDEDEDDEDDEDLTIVQLKEELKKEREEKESTKIHCDETIELERAKVEEIEKEMKRVQDEIKKMKIEHEDILDEKSKIEDVKRDLKKKFEYEKHILENEKKEISKQYNEIYKKLEEAEQKVIDLEGQHSSSTTQGGGKGGKGTSSSAEGIDDPVKRGEYLAELDRFRRKNEELQNDMQLILDTYDVAEKQSEEFREKAIDLEEKLAKRELKFKKLMAFKDELLKQLKSFDSELQERDVEMDQLITETETLENENFALKNEKTKLIDQMNKKNVLMKKMHYLMQNSGVDVSKVRKVGLKDLIQREKAVIEKISSTVGGNTKEMNEKELMENLINDDVLLGALEKYETKEVQNVQKVVYGKTLVKSKVTPPKDKIVIPKVDIPPLQDSLKQEQNKDIRAQQQQQPQKVLAPAAIKNIQQQQQKEEKLWDSIKIIEPVRRRKNRPSGMENLKNVMSEKVEAPKAEMENPETKPTHLQLLIFELVDEKKELQAKVDHLQEEIRKVNFQLSKKEDQSVIEKQIEIRTATLSKTISLREDKIAGLEKKLQTLNEQLKTTKEQVNDLEDEKKTFLIEREKYLQSVMDGGSEKGGKAKMGNYKGSMKNVMNEFFGMRVKFDELNAERKILHRNYSQSRKQSMKDKRVLREQSTIIKSQEDRIKDLERELEITREKFTRRTQSMSNSKNEIERLKMKNTKLKNDVQFYKNMIEKGKTTKPSFVNLSGPRMKKKIRGGGGRKGN